MVANAPFTSIRASSRMPLEIVRQIQQAIFRGDYVPGQRLPIERELVQMFGVSKATVREALRILETYGLIEIRSGSTGGAFVMEMSSHPVSRAAYNMLQLGGCRSSKMYAARLLIEPAVAELACQLACDDDFRSLEESIARTSDLAQEGQETIDESKEFHLILARAINNPVIELIIGSLLDLFKLSGATIPLESTHISLDDHKAILVAMRQHDAAKVRVLMTDHLSKLTSYFAQIEGQGIEVVDGNFAL